MTECIQHGDYAVYVYSSYGLALAVIMANVLWPYLRLRLLRRGVQNKTQP